MNKILFFTILLSIILYTNGLMGCSNDKDCPEDTQICTKVLLGTTKQKQNLNKYYTICLQKSIATSAINAAQSHVIGTKVDEIDGTPVESEKQQEAKKEEVKPTEVKPAEVKPAEVKPTEVKPTEVKLNEEKKEDIKQENIEEKSEEENSEENPEENTEDKSEIEEENTNEGNNEQADFDGNSEETLDEDN
jgi:hypothetical protein